MAVHVFFNVKMEVGDPFYQCLGLGSVSLASKLHCGIIHQHSSICRSALSVAINVRLLNQDFMHVSSAFTLAATAKNTYMSMLKQTSIILVSLLVCYNIPI